MSLTIVMYHYVRDLGRSRYPGIKGRTVEELEGQLDHIARHYTVCTTRQVVEAARGGRALPANACLLTFDDGFIDHYTVVFPRLLTRGLPGSFYPPAAVVGGGRVLDVHKIHFILAVTTDPAALARRVRELIAAARRDVELPTAEALYRRHARPSRFDPADVIFVKRVLQKALPPAVRAAIVQRLFVETVGADEATFARELYLDLAQLRAMVRSGMEVGGHGVEHVWLDALTPEIQREEIARTRAFLAEVHGAVPGDWVLCYPYGAHDATTRRLLAEAGGALGLTTELGIARDLASPLALPRLDTNDLPLRGDARPARWTLDALAAPAAAASAATC